MAYSKMLLAIPSIWNASYAQPETGPNRENHNIQILCILVHTTIDIVYKSESCIKIKTSN